MWITQNTSKTKGLSLFPTTFCVFNLRNILRACAVILSFFYVAFYHSIFNCWLSLSHSLPPFLLSIKVHQKWSANTWLLSISWREYLLFGRICGRPEGIIHNMVKQLNTRHTHSAHFLALTSRMFSHFYFFHFIRCLEITTSCLRRTIESADTITCIYNRKIHRTIFN